MPLLNDAVPFNASTSKTGSWYLTPNGNRVAAEIAAAAAGDGLKTLIFVQSTIASEGSVKAFRALLPDRRVKLTETEVQIRKRIVEEMGGPQYCYLEVDSTNHVVGGATSHHAQLLKDERELHKSLFERRDGLDALFATSTVAQGMNLPSDIVLIAGDSRWDDLNDKMQQLDAHELLNAAGRAGRAGESGQGFVLIVPSRVISVDDSRGNIDQHWMSLQGIFAQSDQCLVIDDPLTELLDRIHSEVRIGDQEEYLLARLPSGPEADLNGPTRTMLDRSFAYRKRVEGKSSWVESRIDAVIARRAEQAPVGEISWLAQVASSTGLPIGILVSLSREIDKGRFAGDTQECVASLFSWLEENPEFMLQLLRPSSVEGLFGKGYKALATSSERAGYALSAIRDLTEAWMAGEPLCNLELAVGTMPSKLKTCEVARHFAVRLASDLAFVAGLPARILAARIAAGESVAIPTVLATFAGAVRRGCNSPEDLANAVYLGREVSRVAAHRTFQIIRAHVSTGDATELFEATLERVRNAHDLAQNS